MGIAKRFLISAFCTCFFLSSIDLFVGKYFSCWNADQKRKTENVDDDNDDEEEAFISQTHKFVSRGLYYIYSMSDTHPAVLVFNFSCFFVATLSPSPLNLLLTPFISISSSNCVFDVS